MKEKSRKRGIGRLIQIADTRRWWLVTAMVLSICSTIAQFIPYVSIYKILTELAAHAADISLIDSELIWRWIYIACGAVVVYGLLLFVGIMCSHIAAFNILYELRMALARKLVRLPMGFFTRKTSGEIKKVMSEDVERIELFVAHHIPDITNAVVFPVLLLGYLFYSDWRLALVALAVYVVALFFLGRTMSTGARKDGYQSYNNALAQMNGSIVEYVRGIQVVKVFNRSTNAFERLTRDINDYKDLALKITYDYAPNYIRFYTAISSGLLFLIPVSIYLLMHAESYSAYVPTVLLFIILGGGMFFPMLKAMWIGGLVSQNEAGVAQIDAILDKDEIHEPTEAKYPSDSSIEFRGVSFGYEDSLVLRDVSFAAPVGSVTALVGPSGAGKTTVAMLTARFWDVTSGEILIGGVSIKDIAVEKLMNNIAFVFQDNTLFFDTIEENIRMGNNTATHEQVVEAAKAAQCHEFIEKLENGYSTLVGEGGTYLSGGEQQRIALARAILKDAPIVLLDEATAYADPENEGKILESFSHLIRNKTVLVIAHRLSTITDADQILLINEGTVEERGRHEELLAREGHYKRMWDSYTQSREWVMNN